MRETFEENDIGKVRRNIILVTNQAPGGALLQRTVKENEKLRGMNPIFLPPTVIGGQRVQIVFDLHKIYDRTR